MALSFYSTLDQLNNPTHDLNGGSDAQQLAQLILQGGQATTKDPRTGAVVNLLGGDNQQGGLSPTFAQALKQAQEMVAGVRGAGDPGMTASPYGGNSFDPTNPASRSAVQAQRPIGADPVSEAFYSTTPYEPAGTKDPRAMSQADINAAIDGSNPAGTKRTGQEGAVGRPKRLVANPYGPGSYDPDNPAERAQILAQAPRHKAVEEARQYIKSLTGEPPQLDFGSVVREITGSANNMADRERLEKIAPQLAAQTIAQRQQAWTQRQASAAPVVKQVLESLGLGENAYQKAFNAAAGNAAGKAAGEKLGGKEVPAGIPPDLLKAARTGAEDFDTKYADFVLNHKGSLTPNQEIALNKMHKEQWNKLTVSDPDTRAITGSRTAYESLKRVQQAYSETSAAKTGKVSDTFKLALQKTAAGALMQDIAPLFGKLTPEERRYVAEFGVFQLNLRGVSQDSRFSNFDSERVIQAVGNPLTGKDQYQAQIGAAVNELGRRHDGILEGLGRQGKRIGNFPKLGAAAPAAAEGDEKSPIRSQPGDRGVKNGVKWSNVGGKIMIGE